MINYLKILVLAAIVLLTDFYIIHPSVRFSFFATLTLCAFFILAYAIPQHVKWGVKNSLPILAVGGSFVFYMAVVDLLRGELFNDVIVQLLAHSVVLAMLPSFIAWGDCFPLLVWFRRFALISLGFAAIQALGIPLTAASLIPFNPVLGSQVNFETLIDSYGRATGATSNTINFALHMVFLGLMAFWVWNRERTFSPLRLGLLAVLGLLFSQTRAALAGAAIAVAFSQAAASKKKLIAVFHAIALAGLAVIVYWLLSVTVAEIFPYVFKREITIGDTHRLWANWYMSVGVFHESPWFGIAPREAWDIYFRYGDLSIAGYHHEQATPTHHNQLGFYFRYYGFVGLTLLFAVYFMLFRTALRAPSHLVRAFLFSALIGDLFYSMTHNNKIMASPLIWIFFSLAYLPANQGDHMMYRGVGKNVR